MAKIFAVIINDCGTLELLSWTSAAEFTRQGCSFLDEKYICICNTNDHLEYRLFKDPHENPESGKGYFGVILDDERLNANHIMCNAFKEHYNKPPKPI